VSFESIYTRMHVYKHRREENGSFDVQSIIRNA
jgi:hypothetical protein